MPYRQIVFFQDPHEGPAAEWLNNAWQGDDDALLDYLQEYDQDGGGEIYADPPWGKADETFEARGYIVSYNLDIPYVGMCQKVDAED